MSGAHFVRFEPPEVSAIDGVVAVAIYPDRLELETRAGIRTFYFREFGRRQESPFIGWMKRLTGRRPAPRIVGVREFCADRRLVGFYTTPKIKIYTPPDPEDYGGTYIARIERVLASGGYATSDLS